MDNYGLKKIWRKDGHDFIADIGNMKKAIVVSRYISGKYGISLRSYFPFDEKDYDKRFENYIDVCNYAEDYIRSWIESIFHNPPQEHYNSLENKSVDYFKLTEQIKGVI